MTIQAHLNRTTDVNPAGDSMTAEALIAEIQRLRGIPCTVCSGTVSFHHALMSIPIGFKDAPHCIPCLADRLKEDPVGLENSLLNYILQRDCYFQAWNWANRQAGLPEETMTTRESNNAPNDAEEWALEPAGFWDAGDQGCGELALELRVRLEKLKPGQVFQLTARDLGVPEDMPAWCRLTGHALLRANHPNYWIRRKN